MNHKWKALLIAALLVATALCFAACGQEQTPYEINDKESYNVSVKFDANGGFFTTNTSVIVDSYNVTGMATNGEGKAEIALLSPDDALRGNDAFAAVNNGYFLAGWYTERTETTDGQGNAAYTYSGRWDFTKDRVTVDPGQTYTAAEPVMTLYAAWIPMFQIRFHDLATGEYLDSYTFNPENVSEISVPAFDANTGAVEMYKFPARSGYTFNGAYLDAAGKEKLENATFTHTGSVDLQTGTAVNSVMDLYIDWLEGEWYYIHTAEQFVDNASVNGSYVLCADLDFTDEIWPSSLMYGSFSGTIQGNGYKMSNITLEQTNNSKTNAGLFGALTETASVTDVAFENVVFTVKSGTRVAGTAYGLFAGAVAANAEVSGVSIADSKLQIDAGAYFGTDDYTIGLLCGMGSVDMDASGVTASVVGEEPALWAVVEDGFVTLTTEAPAETETVPAETVAETVPEQA